MKEKRNTVITSKTSANCAKQRQYVKEGELISSPTVSLGSILTILVIDAYEGRYLCWYASTKKQYSVIKVKGELVDIICNVNSEYTPHIIYEKN